jgi:uncharacterized membrane protein YbhN (UPF0104 family)
LAKRDERVELPDQKSINESVAWGVTGLALLGVSYAVVASQVTTEPYQLATATAFLVAWLIGFAAVPFPAGIGVREAVLVGLLSPSIPGASVVAASLIHRLATIGSEVIVYLASRTRERRRA